MIAYNEMSPNYTASAISKMEFYAPGNLTGDLYFDAISPTLSCSDSFANKDNLTPWRANGTNHWGFQWHWSQLQPPTPPKELSTEIQQDLSVIYKRVTDEIRVIRGRGV